MTFICVGEKVRIYYEDDCFDEGEVTAIIDGLVVVDFYDWIEQWPEDAFTLRELFYEGMEVLVPIHHGTIVVDFRRT